VVKGVEQVVVESLRKVDGAAVYGSGVDEFDAFEEAEVVEAVGSECRRAADQYAGNLGFPVRGLRKRHVSRFQLEEEIKRFERVGFVAGVGQKPLDRDAGVDDQALHRRGIPCVASGSPRFSSRNRRISAVEVGTAVSLRSRMRLIASSLCCLRSSLATASSSSWATMALLFLSANIRLKRSLMSSGMLKFMVAMTPSGC
jgi:hypothetical protein